MSMKEIKVKITGYEQTYTKGFTQFIVEPAELINSFDFSKKYKLVEDEPNKLPGFKGGKIPNQMTGRFGAFEPINSCYGTLSVDKMNLPKDVLTHLIGAIDLAYEQPSRFTVAKLNGTLKQPKRRVQFNGNATILEIGDFKTVVKCHEGEGGFDFRIGLGLALGRYYEKQPSTKKDFKYLKKSTDDWTFALYCISKYFDYDNKRILKFLNVIEKGKWIEL